MGASEPVPMGLHAVLSRCLDYRRLCLGYTGRTGSIMVSLQEVLSTAGQEELAFLRQVGCDRCTRCDDRRAGCPTN